jgi:hypothetical protein
VDPLIGFTLGQAKKASLHDLERVGLEIREEKEQAVFGRGQGAVLIDRKAARRAGRPIKAPDGHMGLEGGFKRRHEELKLLQRQAGEIQKLRGTGRDIGIAAAGHKSTSCF